MGGSAPSPPLLRSPYLDQLQELSLVDALAPRPRIVATPLSSTGSGVASALTAFVNSQRTNALTSLRLGAGTITAPMITVLARAAGLQSLASLCLSMNTLGLEGLRNLAARQSLSRLRSLEVNLVELDLRHAGQLPPISGVTTLQIGFDELGRRGLAALTGDGVFDSVQELSLRGTGLTGWEIEPLTTRRQISELRSLDVSMNRAPDEMTSMLSAAPNLHKLRELAVISGELTKVGLERLVRASNALPALRVLRTAALSCDENLAAEFRQRGGRMIHG